MAFQPVPFTASFAVIMRTATGDEQMCTLYVRNTLVGWNPTTLGAMAATIGNAWRDEVMPNLASVLTLDRVDSRDEGAQFGAQTTTEYNTVGGDVGEAIPANCAALVQYEADTGAPPRQGWLFVPGLTIVSTDTGSLLAPAFAANLKTAIDDVRTQIQGGANAQVLVSRFLNKAKRAEGATNTIASSAVRLLIASQRDRRPGIGS